MRALADERGGVRVALADGAMCKKCTLLTKWIYTRILTQKQSTARSLGFTMFVAWIRSEARSKRIWLDAARGQVSYASKAVERSVVVPGTASPIERSAAFLLSRSRL